MKTMSRACLSCSLDAVVQLRLEKSSGGFFLLLLFFFYYYYHHYIILDVLIVSSNYTVLEHNM